MVQASRVLERLVEERGDGLPRAGQAAGFFGRTEGERFVPSPMNARRSKDGLVHRTIRAEASYAEPRLLPRREHSLKKLPTRLYALGRQFPAIEHLVAD